VKEREGVKEREREKEREGERKTGLGQGVEIGEANVLACYPHLSGFRF
jgi:hypothetical protein